MTLRFAKTHFVAYLLLLGIAATTIADDSIKGDRGMTTDDQETSNMPPEIAAYVKGANTDKHRQFDFLIGHWTVDAKRYDPDGSVQLSYSGTWDAKYLNDKRMVLDDFKALSPTGQEISSFVTLRTYSEFTNRWEIAGLGAHQPSTISEWYGELKSGEMVLNATGKGPSGAEVINRIRFYHIEKNEFIWESNMSFDGGASWMKMVSLVAKRSGN
jgi:hypothetical protein